MLTLIIFSVAHDDERAANRPITIGVHHSRLAGAINGVVERGTTTILKTFYARFQKADIIGEILDHMAMCVKAHHERMVIMRANRMLQKAVCCFLLKLETGMDGTAGINQQAEL